MINQFLKSGKVPGIMTNKEVGRLLQNNVKKISDIIYRVKSTAGDKVYKVLIGSIEGFCSCDDHMFRHVRYKHIYAVEFSLHGRKNR